MRDYFDSFFLLNHFYQFRVFGKCHKLLYDIFYISTLFTKIVKRKREKGNRTKNGIETNVSLIKVSRKNILFLILYISCVRTHSFLDDMLQGMQFQLPDLCRSMAGPLQVQSICDTKEFCKPLGRERTRGRRKKHKKKEKQGRRERRKKRRKKMKVEEKKKNKKRSKKKWWIRKMRRGDEEECLSQQLFLCCFLLHTVPPLNIMLQVHGVVMLPFHVAGLWTADLQMVQSNLNRICSQHAATSPEYDSH